MKKRFAIVLALAGVLLLPMPRTNAADVGAGPAHGELHCTPGGAASVAIASPAFVFEGRVRTVSLSILGDCHALGSSTLHGQGSAHLSGDGLSCGADPAQPLGAALILQGSQAIVVTDGVCVVDGVERRLQLLANGVVVGDGQFVGVLTPDYFTPLAG